MCLPADCRSREFGGHGIDQGSCCLLCCCVVWESEAHRQHGNQLIIPLSKSDGFILVSYLDLVQVFMIRLRGKIMTCGRTCFLRSEYVAVRCNKFPHVIVLLENLI